MCARVVFVCFVALVVFCSVIVCSFLFGEGVRDCLVGWLFVEGRGSFAEL